VNTLGIKGPQDVIGNEIHGLLFGHNVVAKTKIFNAENFWNVVIDG